MPESFNYNPEIDNPEVNDRRGQPDNVLDLDSMGNDVDPIVKVVTSRVESATPSIDEQQVREKVSEMNKWENTRQNTLIEFVKNHTKNLKAAAAVLGLATLTSLGAGCEVSSQSNGVTPLEGAKHTLMEIAKAIDAKTEDARRNQDETTVFSTSESLDVSGHASVTPHGVEGDINVRENRNDQFDETHKFDLFGSNFKKPKGQR